MKLEKEKCPRADSPNILIQCAMPFKKLFSLLVFTTEVENGWPYVEVRIVVVEDLHSCMKISDLQSLKYLLSGP